VHFIHATLTYFYGLTSYIRPLIEHDSVIWSPYTVKDIELIESVQRPFTKRLPGFNILPYAERLKRLDLFGLELRSLHADLIFCYKIVFSLTDLQVSELFETATLGATLYVTVVTVTTTFSWWNLQFFKQF